MAKKLYFAAWLSLGIALIFVHLGDITGFIPFNVIAFSYGLAAFVLWRFGKKQASHRLSAETPEQLSFDDLVYDDKTGEIIEFKRTGKPKSTVHFE